MPRANDMLIEDRKIHRLRAKKSIVMKHKLNFKNMINLMEILNFTKFFKRLSAG